MAQSITARMAELQLQPPQALREVVTAGELELLERARTDLQFILQSRLSGLNRARDYLTHIMPRSPAPEHDARNTAGASHTFPAPRARRLVLTRVWHAGHLSTAVMNLEDTVRTLRLLIDDLRDVSRWRAPMPRDAEE